MMYGVREELKRKKSEIKGQRKKEQKRKWDGEREIIFCGGNERKSVKANKNQLLRSHLYSTPFANIRQPQSECR